MQWSWHLPSCPSNLSGFALPFQSDKEQNPATHEHNRSNRMKTFTPHFQNKSHFGLSITYLDTSLDQRPYTMVIVSIISSYRRRFISVQTYLRTLHFIFIIFCLCWYMLLLTLSSLWALTTRWASSGTRWAMHNDMDQSTMDVKMGSYLDLFFLINRSFFSLGPPRCISQLDCDKKKLIVR